MSDIANSSTQLASARSHSAANSFLPQFPSADYGKASRIYCDQCSHSIYSQYFRVNGQKICKDCAEQIRLGISTPSHGSLVGAFVLGIVGASVGCVLYSSIAVNTEWTVGYLALVVGWIVGRTAIAGARGVGGVRVQIIAASLTYAAIALSALPALLRAAFSSPESVANSPAKWGNRLTELVTSGLGAPFQGLSNNTFNAGMGLLTLFCSLTIAWQLTRIKPLIVSGPFDLK
jgi:hypothetical protein